MTITARDLSMAAAGAVLALSAVFAINADWEEDNYHTWEVPPTLAKDTLQTQLDAAYASIDALPLLSPVPESLAHFASDDGECVVNFSSAASPTVHVERVYDSYFTRTEKFSVPDSVQIDCANKAEAQRAVERTVTLNFNGFSEAGESDISATLAEAREAIKDNVAAFINERNKGLEDWPGTRIVGVTFGPRHQ